jgi:hypothetical protein
MLQSFTLIQSPFEEGLVQFESRDLESVAVILLSKASPSY